MKEAFIVQEIRTSTKGRCGLTIKELNPFPSEDEARLFFLCLYSLSHRGDFFIMVSFWWCSEKNVDHGPLSGRPEVTRTSPEEETGGKLHRPMQRIK